MATSHNKCYIHELRNLHNIQEAVFLNHLDRKFSRKHLKITVSRTNTNNTLYTNHTSGIISRICNVSNTYTRIRGLVSENVFAHVKSGIVISLLPTQGARLNF